MTVFLDGLIFLVLWSSVFFFVFLMRWEVTALLVFGLIAAHWLVRRLV